MRHNKLLHGPRMSHGIVIIQRKISGFIVCLTTLCIFFFSLNPSSLIVMNPALSRFLSRSVTSAPTTAPCRRLPARFQRKYSSHSPVSPNATPPRKKITINTLRTMHANMIPIAMMTAHDFPSGLAADQAHMDMILIGDSLAMVGLGMEVCHKPSLVRFGPVVTC